MRNSLKLLECLFCLQVLLYQPTKAIMEFQDAQRNCTLTRRFFHFVVRLSRCDALAGRLEIVDGFVWRYVARSEPRLARVFSPT